MNMGLSLAPANKYNSITFYFRPTIESDAHFFFLIYRPNHHKILVPTGPCCQRDFNATLNLEQTRFLKFMIPKAPLEKFNSLDILRAMKPVT